MHRIALYSLVHDKGKLVAALAGVAFAATLVLCQLGLYVGFLQAAAAIIQYVGGDVWVMARGTEVVDNGEPLSPGVRSIASAHPCVKRARGIIMSFAVARKPSGGRDAVQVIGFEAGDGPVLPWTMVRGLPHDLGAPGRVAIDGIDLDKLHLNGDPIGQTLEIGGQTVRVAVLTTGIRAFTLSPYVFAHATTARRMTNLGEDQFHYWVLDLSHPGCMSAVAAQIERHPDLSVRDRDEFRRMTQDYWVAGSGAGTALGFSALLGLLVGTVIVGQTLYAVTKEHERELATLKAMGASAGELAGFVLWQAAFLAVLGGILGFALSWAIKVLILQLGLTIVLSSDVVGIGAGAVVLMVALASVGSVRKIIGLQAAEVFQ